MRGNTYILLAGSKASKGFRKSAAPSIKQFRLTLEHDGAIKEGQSKDELIVIKDIPCDSPNGKTLKEMERL